MANAKSFSRDTRQAMVSQFLGFGLDAYDMAMVVVMSPILAKVFVSPGGSAAWQTTKVLLFYSITMAARPVGSAFFGHYADKLGRKNLLIFTIAGVGLMSVIAGFLPTYTQAGAWSLLLFSLLRFLMGCFFGGEYAVGHTFAIEFAPQHKRGQVAGFIQSGFPLGYVFAALVVAAITATIGDANMLSYGWRIAFITGAVPVLLALWIRSTLNESPEFERAKAAGNVARAPFFSLFVPPQLWSFLQVLVFMTGLFLTDYSVYGYLPSILTLGGRGFTTTQYSLIYGFALFMSFLGYNFYGWLSDRTGRKVLTQWYCVFLLAFAIPVYYVLYHAALARNIRMAVAGCVMAAMLKLAWGMLPAYLCERFPTKTRATGVGFGYSSGALIGAWFSIYVLWAHKIPFVAAIEKQDLWLSPAVILTIGSIMTFVSLFFSPETRKLELSGVGEPDSDQQPNPLAHAVA